jgi:protein involved in polysaccharide export with SLBB domain
VGRITVQADPSILTSDPEQDILLEGGDKIYIPRRPLTVRVGGEVLSPAALQFRKGKDAETYIEQAGGTTYYADKDRAFVVYPDGSAKPLSVSAWKQSVTMIPPGSTIIVPRDPKPFDFLESAETISTILANIALSGFYIDDLGDDD